MSGFVFWFLFLQNEGRVNTVSCPVFIPFKEQIRLDQAFEGPGCQIQRLRASTVHTSLTRIRDAQTQRVDFRSATQPMKLTVNCGTLSNKAVGTEGGPGPDPLDRLVLTCADQLITVFLPVWSLAIRNRIASSSRRVLDRRRPSARTCYNSPPKRIGSQQLTKVCIVVDVIICAFYVVALALGSN